MGRVVYAYALGNPISLIDPAGTNVTMTCRPLAPAAAIGLSSPKHCGVIVWHWNNDCPQKKVIDKQFSLAGGTQQPTTDSLNSTYVADQNAFDNPGISDLNLQIAVPKGMTSSQFDAAVITSGNSYTLPGPYNYLGPNSNTAAASIISGAGGVPPSVPDAPGEFWPLGGLPPIL